MTPPPIPAEILELLEEFAYAVEVNGYAIKHNSRTALLSAIARAIAGGRGEPVAYRWRMPSGYWQYATTREFFGGDGKDAQPVYLHPAPPAPEKVDG